MKLQLGQTIAWDGIFQIVVAVNDSQARIAACSSKDTLRSSLIEREQNDIYGKRPGAQESISKPENWANDLLEFLSSLGEEAEAYSAPIGENEIIDSPSNEMRKLRTGQIISYMAHKWVVAVSETGFARLLRIDGAVLAVQNPLMCSLLQPTKTVNLDIFLAINNGKHDEITKHITAEEKEEIMKTNENTPKSAMSKLLDKSNAETAALMAGKTPEEKKAAKAAKDAERYAAKKAEKEAKVAEKAKVKEAKAAAKAVAGVGVRTGRAHETRVLAHDLKMTVEEIHAIIKPKFSTADLSTTRRIVESERANGKSTTA